MGRRGDKSAAPKAPRAATAEREGLERRWFRRVHRDESLARLVTGEQLEDEPFHRWVPYRQGFAPALVRWFLERSGAARIAGDERPLLDPFSGVGTFAVECARAGVAACGVEALPSLAFLARSKAAERVPRVPNLAGCRDWRDVADRLEEPVHRAALLCAVARQYTTEGAENPQAAPLPELLVQVLTMMREDVAQPLGRAVEVVAGDARDLSHLADASISGIFTSPPYLSRHDYTKITRPHEMVFRHWYPSENLARRRQAQVRAHPRSHSQAWRFEPLPVVAECVEALRIADRPRLSGVVRSYFDDMERVLRECARVLVPRGVCWLVVGGARLRGIYVPADLMLAEIGERCGFAVTHVTETRRLVAAGRKLGGLDDVAPREAIVALRRAAE